MIILSFLVILTATIHVTNKRNGALASDEILEFEQQDSLIILLCLVVSIALDWFARNKFHGHYWAILAISSGIFLMILIIVNINREELIKSKHDQIVKVFQALADILGRIDVASIDFNNIPFALENDERTGKINKITIDTSIPGGRVNENTIINAQYSINKFFPEHQWTSVADYPKRELVFKGLPKPPDIATYPGSDYRPTGWIPLGLSGAGEVGWNIADPKSSQIGTSSYITDEGKIPDAVEMPSAPQCLTLGSTGGGKSIWVEQTVQVLA